MDLRKVVKTMTAGALERTGARSLIADFSRIAAGGRRVIVLGYHRVCADFELERQHGIESCLISRSTFSRHVDFLNDRFELVTMSRAVDVLTGQATSSRDVAAITFDDGYQDVLDNALPILRSIGAPATIYLASSVIANRGHFPHDVLFALLQRWQHNASVRSRASRFVLDCVTDAMTVGHAGPKAWLYWLIRTRTPDELRRLCEELTELVDGPAVPPVSAVALNWDGVRTLASAGFELGAHTTSHCVLTHADGESVEAELRASREAIERATQQQVRHFAYCNGYYNQTVVEALKRVGYHSAVTTEDRPNRLGDDPFRIARRVVWEGATRGAGKAVSPSLLACQLDGVWSAIGFDSSESGERAEPRRVVQRTAERRLA